MKSIDELKEAAIKCVSELLTRRMVLEGPRNRRPETCFQCEAGQYRPCPNGGYEVRVHTYGLWSEATVDYDSGKGELLGYKINRYADPASEKEINKEDALEAVAKTIAIPPEADLVSFRHGPYKEKQKVAQLDWIHVHKDLRVDGDELKVVLHPETGHVVEYFCKWRVVDIPLQ